MTSLVSDVKSDCGVMISVVTMPPRSSKHSLNDVGCADIRVT
ncbi:hypothetical protein COLO4_00250 [Corchorus olitorius]|uniref:Uncharacterized protein n=1 Tax=Corchorus olitorius TaxID=93759 RepID=A0A1R3L4B3_9ROSI|nr:hypothetical protein COLO4_00250 [Corchorus olitorius]